jgi:hypothetical protein
VSVRLAFVLALSVATVAAGQQWRGGRRCRRPAPKLPTAASFDGTFNFCRVMYPSRSYEAGGTGWTTDYPDADVNFSIRLSELTKARVSRGESGAPNHLVVRPDDDALLQCPFVLLQDGGTARLAESDVQGLRDYLLKGGFLWLDDFWGSRAWDSWIAQLSRILPADAYPVEDLSVDHPIFRTLFQIKSFPQIPSIQFWHRSGGGTSERGSDSETPHIRGVSDEHGNLMVLMTHNTDIADAWEREGEDPTCFYNFSPDGYAVGINTLMYAMSH